MDLIQNNSVERTGHAPFEYRGLNILETSVRKYFLEASSIHFGNADHLPALRSHENLESSLGIGLRLLTAI